MKITLYTWDATLDEATCPYCEELNGEMFEVDELPDWPAHSHCRCELIPELYL